MTEIESFELIELDNLLAPARYVRNEDKVEDEKLFKSISESGIQQPLIVSQAGSNYLVIDGGRRLNIAKELGLEEVPCVVVIESGKSLTERRRDELRFILDEHQQDLLPSQKAELIRKLKDQFSMSNKEVGTLLGVNPATVGNWLSVERYIPDVKDSLDSGKLTPHAARALDGMTVTGQTEVWEHFADVLINHKAQDAFNKVRSSFSPEQYPEYYVNPDAARRKNAGVYRTRRSAKRKSLKPTIDQSKLLNDIELNKIEISDKKTEIKQLKKEINASVTVIQAILQNEMLSSQVSDEILDEFQRFAEIYIE